MGRQGAKRLQPADGAVGARPNGAAERSLPPLAVPLICVAQLMATLDVTIVNLALPSIRQDIAFSSAGLAWVVDAYTLAYAGMLLVGGRAGDLFGRRRVLMTGIAVFTTSSWVAGVASGAGLLLAARAGQGLGAALATPTTLSMITTLVPAGRDRTRALVAYGAMAGLGITLGLVLGGVLTEIASWRWVFWLNLPLGLLVLTLARRVLPESHGRRRQLDLPGALVGTVALTLVVLGVVRVGEHHWSDPIARAALGCGLLGLVGFGFLQRVAPEPTLPLHLLRHRVRWGAYLVAALLFSCLYPVFLLLSRTLQEVQGHGPIAAGVRFLPIGVGVLVLAMLTRRVMPSTGARPLVVGGAAVTALAAALLITVGQDSGYLPLFVALTGLGAGVGTTFVANAALSMIDVPEQDAGVASGLLSTFQALGGTVGVAALASAAATRTQTLMNDPATSPHMAGAKDALMSGFGLAFALAAGLATIATVVALSSSSPTQPHATTQEKL